MRRIYYLTPLIAATVVDRLITVPNMHLENNPLVLSLGTLEWIVLSTLLLVSLAYLFDIVMMKGGRKVRITAYSCVAFLTVLTTTAVAGNLIVLV